MTDDDDAIRRLERQSEDDDQPVTTVDNLDERPAIALQGDVERWRAGS